MQLWKVGPAPPWVEQQVGQGQGLDVPQVIRGWSQSTQISTSFQRVEPAHVRPGT